MISGKVIWLIAVQFTVFKGCCSFDSNQTGIEVLTSQNTTLLPEASPIEVTTDNNTIYITTAPFEITTVNGTNQSDVLEIFHDDPVITTGTPIQLINITIITNCLNVTSANVSCVEQSWNDTIRTNYTTVAEAVGVSEDLPPFRLQNTAAIAAGVFLVSAVLGYISCVGYRRFLQRKYGNSQILVGEETYDTTDLKYFEI